MKKVGVIVLGITVSVFSLLYYYWTQATELPKWYTTGEKSEQNTQVVSTQSQEKAKVIEEKIEKEIETNLRKTHKTGSDKSAEVKLNEGEVNSLLTSEVSKNADKSKLLKAVKSANTTIKSGKVESGIVANLSDVPVNQLAESELSVLEKLTKAFPHLKNKEVYIGIVGQPKLENNRIKFDHNTEIRVGNLKFPLSEVSKRLNIPQSELEKSLSFELGRLKVNHVEFVGDRALLKGLVQEEKL